MGVSDFCVLSRCLTPPRLRSKPGMVSPGCLTLASAHPNRYSSSTTFFPPQDREQQAIILLFASRSARVSTTSR